MEGELELSRALGDVQYRPVGLTGQPDVNGPVHLFLKALLEGGEAATGR